MIKEWIHQENIMPLNVNAICNNAIFVNNKKNRHKETDNP